MKILFSLLAAQDEAVNKSIELGKRLIARSHQVTFLGNFRPEICAILKEQRIDHSENIKDETFNGMFVASLGAPGEFATLAQKVPSILLVQECANDMMTLRGDFIHWTSLFRSAKASVFATELQRDRVFSSYLNGVDPSRIFVLSSGADPKYFSGRKLFERDYFEVVMSSPILPYTGQRELIATGERLRDFKLIFTFIGDATRLNMLPEGTRKIIEKSPERYQILGSKTENETFEILSKSDLYAHATADCAWSQGIIDAAALGLPLMLSDIDAFNSPWKNGINCLKFPVNSPNFIASSMRMLLQDDVLRSGLSSMAQLTAKRYSYENYYNQVINLAESCFK
jgi:glycosyltransferase involved in cell wall biosynthesis